jgi:ribosomal protein S18 acetylase RimI-like enzyme
MQLVFRNQLIIEDRDTLEKMLIATEFFNPDEINIALELVDDNLQKKNVSDYQFLLAQQSQETSSVIGYTCFGLIPGTKNNYDLYWIVIAPEMQNQHIGKQLLQATEKVIINQNGRKLYAETSGREQYLPTQQFYVKNSFVLEARLKDFYAIGDDKLIFSKNLLQ